ncbi:conserved exported hypothetical protein [metagenome]|uniref:Uncharacterized protein n=1 Tax=metagenome TaxID=256318 RepID=A0A2P2C372_9ZZZZ
MSTRLGALLGVAITGLAGLGAAVVLTAAPAQAAGCSGSHGITVVVDFNQLGGTSVACAAGAARSASSATTAAGFPLSYVQRSPGFVCRISGAPADASCVNTPPATAYWGLFWNDGHGGGWVYASLGAGSLTVPDGGYVGWAWQGSSTRTTPGVTPVARDEPAPTPTRSPTTTPTKTPTKAPTSSSPTRTPSTSTSSASSPTAGQSAAGYPTASATRTKSAKASSSPAPSDSASVDGTSASPTTTETAVIADPADPGDGSGGLPLWVVGGVIAVLIGGAAAVSVLRRRGEHSP